MMFMSNIFQSIGIMVLYSIIVLFVPSLVIRKKLSNQRLYERFMIYVVFGNFYIINIVFILELAHISNRYTLSLLYLIPVLFVLIKPHVREIGEKTIRVLDVADRLTKGSLGTRTFSHKTGVKIRQKLEELNRKASFIGNKQNLEIIAVAALIVLICVIYGSSSYNNYGYLASDIAVHNYWINAMSENNIFVAGVYPHGFHCVIYFMHAVFGIDTSILLRLFATASVVYIHMVLWAFVRYVTKSRYASYGAVVVYVGIDYINSGCISRFSADLPQEFGMIFILPTFYFLFEYMKHERTRTRKDRHYKARKWFELAGAACSFSLCTAVHFYGSMILALFCIAMVAGYFLRIFRPRFFLRLMAALIAGAVFAALPMGVSIAQGNHFQGSIGWGLSVISGSSNTTDSTTNTTTSTTTNTTTNTTSTTTNTTTDNTSNVTNPSAAANPSATADNLSEAVNPSETADNSSEAANPSAVADSSAANPSVIANPSAVTNPSAVSGGTKVTKKPFKERLTAYVKKVWNGLHERLKDSMIKDYSNVWWFAMPISLLAVIIYGFMFAVIDRDDYDSDYGNQIVTIGIGVLLIMLMTLSSYIGIPSIMDVNRGRIYFMYSYAAVIGIVLDMIPAIVSRFVKRAWIYNIPSAVITVAFVVFMTIVYGVREPMDISRSNMMQTNGAVYSMYSILNEHKDDDNWTIVSPTDELQMLDGRGYHTELSDFMRYQRRMVKFTIPTKYVYFFIEKMPLDYTVTSEYSGREVSLEGAKQVYTDSGSGNSVYKGKNRYIIMSKAYYWAKSYMEAYPEDFTVYYEDDEFICYQLIQNTSFLNNLMIDFKYNR